MANSLVGAQDNIRLQLASEKGGVFTETQLRELLLKHRDEWGLAASLSCRKFVAFLSATLGLRAVELRSERYKRLVRYGWGEYSHYLMALSLRPRSYLSHGTAVFLHALNDQIPKTIYANQEQSAKPSSKALSQERLALAFSHRQRMSNYIYSMENFRVVLLSGKQTGDLGVTVLKGPQDEDIRGTGIPRTLIDIVVRPAYAGGIVQVLEAYRGAKGKVEAEEIVRTLQKLGHAYPYHQSIGFLMERAGFAPEECAKLRRLGTKLDFYLLHGMKKAIYDPKWRLFIPEGI
jgi:predicted transcriptional regulator of viral defense system